MNVDVLLVLLLLLCRDLPVGEGTPGKWAALHRLSVDLELTDPEGAGWSKVWDAEVDWHRSRLAEAVDAPRAECLGLLPPHEVCKDRLAFAKQRACRMAWQRSLSCTSQAWVWQAACEDQACRVQLWEDAERATNPRNYLCTRRLAMRRLGWRHLLEGLPCWVDPDLCWEKD